MAEAGCADGFDMEIWNDGNPFIPIYNEVKILGATKNLEGFQLCPGLMAAKLELPEIYG